LRYPWPAVAKRAARALVQLERREAIPQLIAALAAGDPRLPQRKNVCGKEVNVVREVIKINHHHNCLLCHAPGEPADPSRAAATALPPAGPIPLPGEPLPPPSLAYYQAQPQDLVVRFDVSYLRQDFSMTLPVARAAPWPTMQRFDFLVRARVVSADDAALYRQLLARRDPDAPTPYERTMHRALRALTGRDAEPTAVAWRKALAP
jgi:hypothetical protein